MTTETAAGAGRSPRRRPCLPGDKDRGVEPPAPGIGRRRLGASGHCASTELPVAGSRSRANPASGGTRGEQAPQRVTRDERPARRTDRDEPGDGPAVDGDRKPLAGLDPTQHLADPVAQLALGMDLTTQP